MATITPSNTSGAALTYAAASAGGDTVAFAGATRPVILVRNSTGPLAAPTGFTATAVATGGTFAAATYYWKVTATNATGETVGSAEASAAIALNGSATLSWTAVPGATGYRVYRSTTAGGESTSPAFVSAPTGTSYTDTGTAATAGSVPASNTTTGAPITVTLTAVTACNQGSLHNQVVSCPVGDTEIVPAYQVISPAPATLGQVSLTYSSVTSLTVAAVAS